MKLTRSEEIWSQWVIQSIMTVTISSMNESLIYWNYFYVKIRMLKAEVREPIVVVDWHSNECETYDSIGETMLKTKSHVF